MESKTLCCTRSEELKICVIIPVYNHASTLGAVVEAVKHYCSHIIVVNDGSTDQTPELIQNYGNTVQSISYFPNRGKGYALKKGFQKAISQGFHYAITLD